MKSVMDEKLTHLLAENEGKAPAFTDLGGYPIVYYAVDDAKGHPRRTCEVVCAKCANMVLTSPDDWSWSIWGCDIYYEGAPETCTHCGEQIESAYGDVEENEVQLAEEAEQDAHKRIQALLAGPKNRAFTLYGLDCTIAYTGHSSAVKGITLDNAVTPAIMLIPDMVKALTDLLAVVDRQEAVKTVESAGARALLEVLVGIEKHTYQEKERS